VDKGLLRVLKPSEITYSITVRGLISIVIYAKPQFKEPIKIFMSATQILSKEKTIHNPRKRSSKKAERVS
jgi:hypothetical protein